MSQLPRPPWPSTTVTFLFADIEGSTELVRQLGEEYASLVHDYRSLIRRAVSDAGGTEVDTEGDGLFVVFPTPSKAVRAAIAAQRSLADHRWPGEVVVRARMGLHTGEAVVAGGGYVGFDVHRAARIMGTASGGQIVVSEATRTMAEETLPNDVTLRDLGHHRLKGLPNPEHLFQLCAPGLPTTFPPLRSLGDRKSNLPIQVTSFVGRQRELAEIGRLLGETRLLTLTGPGGTGKSRLAIEAAADRVGDFPDGVFFVALAPVRDAALVPATISAALGMRPTDGPVLDSLKQHLADRECLLVLDNFEHLLAASPLIGELLHGAERLRVLVTSRALLRVSGEQELCVPPMELPDPGALVDPDALCRCEALALFVQRARAVDAGFTLSAANAAPVSEICARLDGLPLAIELAAARLHVFSPQLLLERLERRLPLLTAGPRDAPERLRTLRSTMTWSHDLLSPAEQMLFRRLSVFAGGCTLAAAEAVAGGDDLDVVEEVSSLVEKSLVRVPKSADEPRLSMLETIREYAQERLVESGEAGDVERRHALFYLALAEEAEPRLTGAFQASFTSRLEGELANFRAALGSCTSVGDAETGLRMASALWRFWQQRGELEEGRQWLERLFALPAAAARTAARGKALNAAAALAYWQGDYGQARRSYEEALSICRELGDGRGAAEALHSLAYLAGIEGDYEEAHALHRQSSDISRQLGDLRAVAYDLVGDGMISQVQGDFPAALAQFEEARAMFEDLGEGYGLATVLCLLSGMAVRRGDLDGAENLWRRSFELLRELGDRSGMVIALSDLSAIQLARGRTDVAVRLAAAAEGLGETLKVQPPAALIRPCDPRPEAREEMGEEAVEGAWRAGRALSFKQAVELAIEVSGIDDDLRRLRA